MTILKTTLDIPALRRFSPTRRLGRKIKQAGRETYNRLSLQTRAIICITAVILSALAGVMTPFLFG